MTVACSTYGRAALLPRMLEALAAQDIDPSEVEVVVVDDASPDDTAAVLDRLAAQVPFELRVLRQPVNRGAAAGRNRAWRAARAPIVAFTDDDCVPSAGWLRAGVDACEAAPPSTFVVGRTAPDPEALDLLARPFSRSLAVHEPRFFETCNIFYRRDDLECLGGFDEAFGTGEDTDLGLRMVDAGRRPHWAPDALVHHRVRPPSFRAHLREARRWADLALVVKRHPGQRAALAHRRIFWKRTHPPAVAALTGLGVAAATRHRWAAVAVLWWVWHRLVVDPACPGPKRRVAALPGTFVVDAAEVLTMVEGSLRHRTLLL